MAAAQDTDQEAAEAGPDAETGRPAPDFEQVLDDPGDLELSYRYARAQIEQGNLSAAATTLDRMLLQRPDLHQVRLLYAIVLFRLDNLSGAEAELERVDRTALSERLQAELDRYRERIQRRQRSTRGTARIGVGVAYESNPTAAPESGEALALGIPLDVRGADGDASFRTDGRVELRHELATQLPVELFARAGGAVEEQVEADSQDTAFGTLSAGARLRTPWLDVTPSLQAGVLGLSDETFYSFVGPQLRLAKPLDGKVELYAEAGWRAERFHPITESPSADDRSGNRYDLTLGFGGQVLPELRAEVGMGVTRKTADADFEAYEEARVFARATAEVFGDHFIQAAVRGGRRSYDAADPFVSPQVRDDAFVRARLSYGLPVPGAERLDEALEGLRLVPSVSYYRQHSNIRNFTYDNLTASLMLHHRFRF